MNQNKITISGTGCALADFLFTQARFDSVAFKKYLSKQDGDGGLCPGKLVFTEELEKFAQQPYASIFSEIVGNDTFDSFNIGGPALVALINAAQLLDNSDFEISFYGCTGNDETSKLIFDKVRQTPLNINNYHSLGAKNTAYTHVLSDPSYDDGNGERTFINNIGASRDYLPEMLPESFFEANIVCFGGTALVPKIHNNLTQLLKKAKANHCITIVNTVFDFRNEKENPGKPWPLGNTPESLPLIDVLIMDCEEALKISRQKSIDEAAAYFVNQNLSSFIITNGSKNLYAFSNGNLFKSVALSTFPVSALVKSELKNATLAKGDTTGCGDNFAGGIIASLAWQLKLNGIGSFNLHEALSWAVASGGFACFYAGGTYFENYTGEKYTKVKTYQQAYLKQVPSHE